MDKHKKDIFVGTSDLLRKTSFAVTISSFCFAQIFGGTERWNRAARCGDSVGHAGGRWQCKWSVFVLCSLPAASTYAPHHFLLTPFINTIAPLPRLPLPPGWLSFYQSIANQNTFPSLSLPPPPPRHTVPGYLQKGKGQHTKVETEKDGGISREELTRAISVW